MLRNRFMRFLTSILITIALFLLVVFVLCAFLPPYKDSNSTDMKASLGFLILVPCAVGLVYQLLCDVLNIRILCGAIGTWIKNVVFFVLTAASAVLQIGCMIAWSSTNFYSNTLVSGISLSSTLTGLAFMIATSSDYDPKYLPFLTPISVGAGLILGLIYAGVATIKQVQMNEDLLMVVGILFSLAILVVMVIWKIKVDGPFTDFGYADGDYSKTGSFLHDGRSKDGGKGTDDRMDQGLISELDSEMRSVASNFSGTLSAGCGDSLTMRTSYEGTSSHVISFSTTASIRLSESTLNGNTAFVQSQVQDLLDQYRSECERIYRAAQEALHSVQKYYKGYDDYRISIDKGKPSIRN